MPGDEQEWSTDSERPNRKEGKRWFRRNQAGPGWHPGSWQGWLILAVVAAIVTLAVLLRTGAL